jgi:trimethylamine--corrinoid protein Co-methyltransferase
MQTEYLYPTVGDRKSPNEWTEQGALDVATRAMHKVEEILGSHYPSHIANAVDAEIRSRFPVKLARTDMQPTPEQSATRRVGSR